jgi:Fe-S cluster assembly protein SufD
MNIENYNQFKQKFPLESLKAATFRQEAFERFQKIGLPTKKDEAWKYTSVKSFSELSWSLATEEEFLSHDDMKWLSTKLSTDFYNFVFVNGFLNQTLSDELESWISFDEIGAEIQADQKVVTEGGWNDLLVAGSAKQINLKIAKSKVIDKPVQILFVQKSNQNLLSQSVVRIELGENSQVKLIQNFVSLPSSVVSGKENALNISTQVHLGVNSNLNFIQLQNENHKDFHFSRAQFYLQSGAQLLSLDLALGGQLSRHYLEAVFLGENANAGVYGLTALSQKQHTDHYTFIHHQKGANQSVQHYKSILSDESHSVFRGRVRIEPLAQKANSEQLNNNLLLTKTAHADSVPQLEIYADDVKAGHGSTMGQLNKDEIFYFLSRGINQTEAVRMLAFGYALELVYKIENADLQKWILKTLNEKLESMIPNV